VLERNSVVSISEWAAKWGVSQTALDDLRRTLHPYCPPAPKEARLEAESSAVVRIEASRKGKRLWRNNVGVMLDERGMPVRYGLANESEKMNKVIKSSDLIGIQPILITYQHVGATIGQFVSREMKRPGWVFSGTEREVAQRNWLELILAFGGDAAFATGEGTL
jgi:hypothetical protein